jgi:hypothetical protein
MVSTCHTLTPQGHVIVQMVTFVEATSWRSLGDFGRR